MDPIKSSDCYYTIIAALLHDVSETHGIVFNTRSLKLTLNKVKFRLSKEGPGFLTKTLPRLGKAFDKALTGSTKLNCTELGFKPYNGSKLPRFLGELFSQVLSPDGEILPTPCVECVKSIRQILYLFYKYELPYTDEQEREVVAKFERTENDLLQLEELWRQLQGSCEVNNFTFRKRRKTSTQVAVVREARILLSRLLACFDPLDIHPRHGPGAVATKQRLWAKYQWTNVASRITDMYPFDAYFCASAGHVCDSYTTFSKVGTASLPAKVILVPKDSRGPRLISCEPVDYQWVQQGLGRALSSHVERHYTTRYNVFFTNQLPNRFGAILGSKHGRYSTLDLNEASDRVSVGLVRLLFPPHIYEYLEAARSLSTVLPDGRVLKLNKFAPMGSALCFPILALTVWAILSAAAPDVDTRESILVYGDDVIVPTTFVGDAIERLESFGLRVNRDKSCTTGFFRESCGMDAFMGIDVTPVRLRTVWSSTRSADVYTSWIAYANSFYDKRYFRVYDSIVERLHRLYGAIPSDDMFLTCPSLRFVSDDAKPKRRRWNKALQKLEYNVWDVRSPIINKTIGGWEMLLRYFAEKSSQSERPSMGTHHGDLSQPIEVESGFRVSQYTSRRTSMLVRRWR